MNFGKNMVIANFGKDVNMNVVWYVMMYDADKEIVCPHGDMSEKKTFSNWLGSLEIGDKAEVYRHRERLNEKALLWK